MTAEFYKKDGADWCRLTIDGKVVFDTTTEEAAGIAISLGFLFAALFITALSGNSKPKPIIS